jgi:subtilase family serine protease
VVNRGSAAAPGAEVSLAVDGAAVDTVLVGSLEPGEAR